MQFKGISVAEAAKIRHVRVEEIYRLIRAGRIRASKLANKWVIYWMPDKRRMDGR